MRNGILTQNIVAFSIGGVGLVRHVVYHVFKFGPIDLSLIESPHHFPRLVKVVPPKPFIRGKRKKACYLFYSTDGAGGGGGGRDRGYHNSPSKKISLGRVSVTSRGRTMGFPFLE